MESNTEILEKMFPNIDPSVIGMILENVRNNVEEAMELLLDMSGGDNNNSHSVSATSKKNIVPLADNNPILPSWPSLPSSSSDNVRTKSSSSHSSYSGSGSVSKFKSHSSSSLKSIGSQITSSKNEENKETLDCIQDIENSVRVLVIMRGLPGSGKSTLARK